MLLDFLKHNLIEIKLIRDFIYRKRYNIDSKSTINHCFFSAPIGDSINLKNSVIGEKKITGAIAVRIHIKHNGKIFFEENAWSSTLIQRKEFRWRQTTNLIRSQVIFDNFDLMSKS